MAINIYIGEKSDVLEMNVSNVNDLVKPLLNKSILSDDELLRKYGKCYDKYDIVYNVNDSDFCILPYAWNHYYNSKQLMNAKEFIRLCKSSGKEILTLNLGDFGVKPLFNDVIILRQSGYQSNRLQKQFALPVFFSDPVDVYFNGKLQINSKKSKALVGFCGQGKQNGYKYLMNITLSIYRNSLYYTGISPSEAQVIYPSTLRRYRVLRKLKSSSKIETDFIIRTKYRAGIKGREDGNVTKLEFYNNIRNSDYTVCIRGGGNFSVRFYEALVNGKIPLFINTDSVLPIDNMIDWKKHVVWIEEEEIKNIDEILADFHNQIHPDDFIQMQLNNRKLWEEYLSFEGFYCHLNSIVESVKKGK